MWKRLTALILSATMVIAEWGVSAYAQEYAFPEDEIILEQPEEEWLSDDVDPYIPAEDDPGTEDFLVEPAYDGTDILSADDFAADDPIWEEDPGADALAPAEVYETLTEAPAEAGEDSHLLDGDPDYEDISGWKLTGNWTVPKDARIWSGPVDLNGYTLTIQGRLIHSGGELIVGGGTLIVEGDYYIAHQITEAHYESTDAALVMENEADHVQVKGDFYSMGRSTYYNETENKEKNALTAGIMDLEGDCYWESSRAYGTHTVRFNRGSGQKVSTSWYEDGYRLNIIGAGGDGVLTWDGYFNAAGLENDMTIKAAIGGLMLDDGQDQWGTNSLNGHHLTIQGDVSVTYETNFVIGEGGTLTIDGNLIQGNGLITLGGGTMIVTGDYRILQTYDGRYSETEASTVMRNDADYVRVEGDFYPGGGYSYYHPYEKTNVLSYTAGIFELKGNIYPVNEEGYNHFLAFGTHRFVLSGGSGQVINTSHVRFNILETAPDCIPVWEGSLDFTKLGSDLTVIAGKGSILLGCSTSFYGDMERTFDLNGHDLTVRGNIDGMYGTVKIGSGNTMTVEGNLVNGDSLMFPEGGTLQVSGDYRIQRWGRISWEDEQEDYIGSTGALVMMNDEDHVIVGGDFYASGVNSYPSHIEGEGPVRNVLSAGVLEIGGDFYQPGGYQGSTVDGFHAIGTHRVILNGDGRQFVYLYNPDYSAFATLEITQDPENYIFNRVPCWAHLIRDGRELFDADFGDFLIHRIVTEHGSEAFISGYVGESPYVEIPDTLYDLPVTGIDPEAFSNMSRIETLSLPSGITTIGYGAFSDCSSLTELEIPSGVTVIEYSTFYNCTSLERLIIPESVVSIDSSEAEQLQHTTLYVYPGSYAETFAIENGIEYVYLTHGDLSSITAHVLDENGEELSDGFSLNWREGETGQFLSTGRKLSNTQAGETYRLEVLLDEEMLFQYQQPAERVITSSGTDQTEDIVLKKIEQVTVEGIVKSPEGDGIEGAVISFRQVYNGSGVKTLEAQTDGAGAFSIGLDATTTTAVISADGYYDEAVSFIAGGEEGTALDIVLRPIPSNRIALTMSKLCAAEPEGPVETAPVTNFNHLSFLIYNETQKKDVKQFTAQYPYLYLEDAALNAGDVLRLSVTDEAEEVSADDLMVTLDESLCGNCEWILTENGRILLTGIVGEGDQTVMLFNAQQRLVESRTVTSSYRSKALPEGIYTCVIMNKTPLLRKTDTVERLAEYGLAENTDFAKIDLSVQKGSICAVSDVQVPDFDESRLYYTVPESTRVWTSKLEAATAQYVDIRAMYEIDEKYESSGETVRFELPEGVRFVSSSLTVNGKPARSSLEGNVLTVPVLAGKGTIRFYTLLTEAGTKSYYASLLFDDPSGSVVQPIGSCQVEAVAASIRVPSQTNKKTVTASGRTAANCTVTLYDNGTPVGTVETGSSGVWNLTFDLVRPMGYSVHDIHATVISRDYQTNIETDAARIVYNVNYVRASKVIMLNVSPGHGEYQTVFDFIKPGNRTLSYNYGPSEPTFTFVATFDGDTSRFRKVYVVTTDRQGAKTYIPCTYDEAGGMWIGTHDFTDSGDIPCRVGVSYETEEGDVYDPQVDASDLAEMMVSGQRAQSILELQLDEKTDTLDMQVEEEKVSFDLSLDGETFGTYQAEVLDYADFNLEAWEDDNYMVFEYEDGSLSYQHVEFTEDSHITYWVYPQEMLYVREMLTILPRSSGRRALKAKALNLGNCYDYLKKFKDWTTASVDFMTDMTTFLDYYLDFQTLQSNVYVLRDGLRRLRGRRDSCKCVDNSILDGALGDLEKEINDYEQTGMTMIYTAVGLTALLNITKGKLGKMVTTGAFNGTKYLYRIMQKRAGLSGKGALKKWHKRGMTLLSELIGEGAEAIFKGGEAMAGLLQIQDMIRQANQDYFLSLQSTVNDLINRFRNLKCKCDNCECYKEEEEEEQTVVPIIDPSGYVYEAVPSNRVSDVKTELYYYDYEYDEYGIRADEKSEIFWDAYNYDQINPQYTDASGCFAWDVPEGQWVVKFSKDGYEDADSYHDDAADAEGYLPVPPIQTEVNTAIVSKAAPVVKSVSAAQDEVRIEFSQYMQPDTVNTDNVTVSLNGMNAAGTIEPLNAEADYKGEHTYASVFVFRTEQKLTGSVTVSINKVRNYNGTAIAGPYQQSHKVLQKPERIQVTGADMVIHHGDAALTIAVLPKEAGADRKVTVTSLAPSIISIGTQTVTTDQDGKATILLHGELPGQSRLIFTLEGTDLTAEKSIGAAMAQEPFVTFEESAFPVSVSTGSYIYNGREQRPSVSIAGLTEGTDYSVAYTDNINAGTGRIKVQGLGRYSGTIEKTFTIGKAANTLTASDMTVSASAKTQSITVHAKAAAGKIMYRSDNKNVKVDANGKLTIAAKFVGKAAVTLSASDQNHQTAAKTITVIVNPAKVTLKSAANVKGGKLTAKWAQNVTGDGYELQYAASSKFTSGRKTVKIKKNKTVKKTIAKLKKGKKYYVRIRAYKKVGKAKYYSEWSAVKTVKIKK